MAMKKSSRMIFDYLKAHSDEDFTSDDLARILGLTKRSVDGSFTTAIQRKRDASGNPLGERVPAEIELENGLHKSINLLKLTNAGLNYDFDAEEA